MNNSNNGIILFDGVCNFCNNSINLVIRKDKRDYFRFAPLQSEAGKILTAKFNIDTTKTDSVLLIENDALYSKSTAALRIARKMDGLFPLCYALIIIPKFLRDPIYDYIAKRRYRWFGKKESCMIPTPEIRKKFI
ncbi:MAG: DCC1-like thiol-disulfide oxidoreductase family protein [Bacteroidetes bacterium]|jgi:predicted DCC family thiol-disulfide oxidoreductase YuxK|nr:DCC1-like thiol-disulfide oxidoreductase family protein [Bacteroidota bacterium]